jgi:NAD(P)-dependent dehydrogenase (short-subunit alcohol dehydrogenase family)
VVEVFSLDGKVAIVTGAAGLLGRQHCHALAEAGATVVAADLDRGTCDVLTIELRSGHSAECLGCEVDITDARSVTALRDTVLGRYDRVDILVNNAAVDDVFKDNAPDPEGFEDYPLARWQRLVDVNLTGTFLCCQIIGTEMARRGGGSIINVASTYGLVAPDQGVYRKQDGAQSFYKSAAYPATKAAVVALTRYLATYWGQAAVRVNCLCPGGVENGQAEFFVKNYSARTPLGRMAQRHEFRGAIVFLASDEARYMTGASLVIDGGWTTW